MNYLSRLLGALPPICAVLAAGAATLGSGHSASAKTLSFSGMTPSRAASSSQSRDAFVRVGVTATSVETPTDFTKVGGFSNLLGSTAPSPSAFRLVQAVAPTQFSFTPDNTTDVNEGDGFVILTVTRTSTDVTSELSVNYATANGPANGGAVTPDDYTGRSGTLTFRRNETTKTISIPIIDDAIFEGPQTFNVALSLPAGATNQTITNSPATVQIIDNDASIQLDTVTATVDEAAGTARVRLVRDGGTTAAANVIYTVTDGTAVNGEDYSVTNPGTVTFPVGATETFINVPIINDSLDEVDEDFVVTLTGAATVSGKGTNGLGANTTTTVTIQDNDNTFVSFRSATDQVDEGSGTYSVVVSRPNTATNDISRAITVDYQTNNGSAQAPQDYTTESSTLTFDAGVRTQTIEIPIIDDNLAENTETFQVKLSNPQFVTPPGINITPAINPIDTITVSILDNDSQVNFNQTAYTVDESVGTFQVPVTRKFNTGVEATVDYSTFNGSAIGGQDYTITTGTLTFAPGETTKNIPVPIINDASDENSESFTIRLSNPSASTSLGPQFICTITITDDDDIPTITVSNVSKFEGNSGQSNLSFVATLSAPSGRTITLNYTTEDGSATTADQDYVASSGPLRFDVDPAQGLGPKTQNINVVVNGDTKFESNEAFILRLLSATNATLITKNAIGTIVNDDEAPKSTFNFEPVQPSVVENDPSGTAKVTIKRSGDVSNPASVTVNTVDGTAIGGADYTPISTVVNFTAGETSRTITIPIQNESVNEADETFQVVLSKPTTFVGTVELGANSTATVTILNDDPAPTLVIDSASVVEGNSGTTNLIFSARLRFTNPDGTVNQNGSSEQTLSVQYATKDGTATVANRDYVATTGTLTFLPGETEKTFTVVVNGDEVIEGNETLSVIFSNAQNISLSNASVTGTITNDDTPPTFSNLAFAKLAYTVGEADGKVTLVVTRTTGDDRVASINYATANGTATAGLDYTAKSGTITFPVGVKTANIEVPIINDTLQEPGAAETFTVTLSNPGGNGVQPSRRTATVSITDNEGAPALSIADAETLEGDSGRIGLPFTVSLFPQSKSTVRVNVTTVQRTGAGAATSGQDYLARTATLTFYPGQATQTFIVYINGNTIVEDDETFSVQLSAPQGAPIAAGKSVATGTIINDDEPGGGGTISFLSASYAVNENVNDVTATPANSVKITLGRSGRIDDINAQSASVRFTTGRGTATANQDYRPVNQLVTFPAGETMASVFVPIYDDNVFENDEVIPLTLSNPSDNAILGSLTSATLTITDNDPRSLIPRAGSISPTYASGTPFTVTSTYSTDSEAGFSDLSPVLIQYGGNINGGGFRALYDPKTNYLSLDPSTGQRVRPGSAAILTNQYGSLDARQTTVTRSGNTITVTWRISLTSKVALYAYSGATSASSGQSAFIRRGTWQPPAATSSTNGS